MEEYNSLIRQHAEYKKVKQEKFRCDSKDRLSKILRKKVETTSSGSFRKEISSVG